jgi:hypothetical protein
VANAASLQVPLWPCTNAMVFPALHESPLVSTSACAWVSHGMADQPSHPDLKFAYYCKSTTLTQLVASTYLVVLHETGYFPSSIKQALCSVSILSAQITFFFEISHLLSYSPQLPAVVATPFLIVFVYSTRFSPCHYSISVSHEIFRPREAL